MKGEALWPYALEVYGRPGVEAILLELQDVHAQCVPFLLWSLWLAANDRAASNMALTEAAELARAWQAAAIEPLRRLRRELKAPGGGAAEAARRRLREGVKALELDAERMLLQMLEDAGPAPACAHARLEAELERAVRAWGAQAPALLLARLARLAA